MSVETRITDVAPTLYVHEMSQRPIENIEQIQEDLWTWWAEADLRPSPIHLQTIGNKLQDKYGNDLVLQAKAASIIRKGRVEQERIDAELMGVMRLGELLPAGKNVIYLSPPGSEREGFGVEGRRKLSFTYLYLQGNNGKIHFLAIPELEQSGKDHFRRIIDLIEYDNEIDMDDRSLVAHPFVAKDRTSFDTLAQRMGYVDLLDMWKRALEARKLRGRVGEIIQHTSYEIWKAKHKKNTSKLEIMGDVFRGMIALLVSDGLADVQQLGEYFNEKIEAIWETKQIDLAGGSSYLRYEPHMMQVQEFYLRMMGNERAMDIVKGGGCPGDRSLGFGQDLFNGRETILSNHVLMDVVSEKEESYSFDRTGKCVVCKGDPRMLGPCGICEECDHKIRSQGE